MLADAKSADGCTRLHFRPSVEVHRASIGPGPPQAAPGYRPTARSPDGPSTTCVMATADFKPATSIGRPPVQWRPSAEDVETIVTLGDEPCSIVVRKPL